MPELTIDTYGREIRKAYSVILTDPTFERRLKAFDPRLRLLFDQGRKRWTVVEWAYDESGWNCILVAEDDEGNPKPLGDWVFNKLWVFRHRYDAKRTMGANRWLDQLQDQAKANQAQVEKAASEDNQARIKEDITQWRKAAKDFCGDPVADATAGYRKI